MITLTSDQWELYLKKYNKLMWTIAHRISGDTMVASLEDNYSDLSIAAIESINGFHKKTGKSFDEMITMKLFDQYTKTCLWTAKARKGVKLTERMPFRKKHVSLNGLFEDSEMVFDIPDTSSLTRYYGKIDHEDVSGGSDARVKNLISTLENNPDLLTEGGEIKFGPTAKKLNVSVSNLKSLLKIIEGKN